MSDRFAFGKNWERFLSTLGVDQIEDAKRALVKLIGTDDLKGKSFLDIGSGSGLHSLAAFLLGAKVHSFDYDMDSVRCTQALQSRYGNDEWTVEQGSALDRDYLAKLGEFDLVYSWGVLHHTGDMKTALELAGGRVKTGGTLAIAIYNTQLTTPFWKIVKRCYVKSPNWLKVGGGGVWIGYFAVSLFFADLLRQRSPLARYKGARGMRFTTDVIDWIGGYPFETATPAEIFAFYRSRNFTLENMTTVGWKMGCNEFVFRKENQ